MVHKRYIKRGGKTYGPYYYKTIRDKDGKVRSIYLGQDIKAKRRGFMDVVQQQKYPLFFIVLFIFLFLGLYYMDYTGFSIFNPDPIKISELESSNLSVGERFMVKVYSDISPAAYFTDDTDLFNISNEGIIDFIATEEQKGVHTVAVLAKYQEGFEYKILRFEIT